MPDVPYAHLLAAVTVAGCGIVGAVIGVVWVIVRGVWHG